jgi:hypothetical protein
MGRKRLFRITHFAEFYRNALYLFMEAAALGEGTAVLVILLVLKKHDKGMSSLRKDPRGTDRLSLRGGGVRLTAAVLSQMLLEARNGKELYDTR